MIVTLLNRDLLGRRWQVLLSWRWGLSRGAWPFPERGYIVFHWWKIGPIEVRLMRPPPSPPISRRGSRRQCSCPRAQLVRPMDTTYIRPYRGPDKR